MSAGSIVATPADLLEDRALLSGPQLVTVIPNTGGFIYNGGQQNTTQTEAPKEVTLKFSPGVAIDATTLGAITVTRAGTDNIFGNGNDQAVAIGFKGVAVAGHDTNEVTLRFADTLPDELYRITIGGGLKSTAGDAFNSGNALTVDFRVDYGTQVVSVVPQPILRTENLNVLNVSKIADGDKLTITAGGTTARFEFDLNGSVSAGYIGIQYTLADTPTQLAQKIAAKLSAAPSGLNGVVTATQNGTTVQLSGTAFTPGVNWTTAQSGGLSLTDGALSQKKDTLVAYFNQNALDPVLATDPGFYQVIDTSNGSILYPTSVQYSSVSNTAVLKFASDLPNNKTWQLQIGAPQTVDSTISTALEVGTLFQNTGGFQGTGFVGNADKISTAAADVDLYKFNVLSSTTVTIQALSLAAGLNGPVVLRLFDSTGAQIAIDTANNSLSQAVVAGTYYIGVSSSGNDQYSAVSGAGAVNGAGTGSYKLQVGVSASASLNPANDTTSFATATNLGTLGAAGQTLVDQQIAPLGNLAYPPYNGGLDEPGHRELPITSPGREDNASNGGTTPTVPGQLPVQYFNFQDVYGTDPQGNTLHNAITEIQKQRAREIFEIYGAYLGIKFVETDNQGITVVTGDVRALDPNIPPDSAGGLGGGGMAIQNGNLNWGNSEYGGSYFQVAFQEIGHALGFHHGNDAPGSMGQGLGGGDSELVFPGDITLQQALRDYAPDSTDINIYQFQVNQAGTLTAETIAQRIKDQAGRDNPSLLDTVLTLYKETYVAAQGSSSVNTNGAVTITFTAKGQGAAGNGVTIAFTRQDLGANAGPTITVNNKAISVVLNSNATGFTTAQKLVDALNNNVNSKALIAANVTAGNASTNVAASANPIATVTLAGGSSVRSVVARNDDYFGRDSFVNLHLETGVYYIAVSSIGNTEFDPNVADTGFGGRTDGKYNLSLKFNPDAVAGTTLNDTLGVALDGDGDATTGGVFNFWFKTGSTIFVDKANFNDLSQTGSIDHPFSNINTALANAAPGSIVRIVGNGGADGQLSTLVDDLAYQIGFDSQNNPAQDGSTFIIPKDVTVMIDAGAIVKLRSAIIDVGDSVVNIDRSGSALQVLGTPGRNVYFTSLSDASIGGNTDPLNLQGAAPGNWGGIRFNQASDVQSLDYRGSGIYLNSVNQGTFTYGGGQVVQESVLQIFNPLHISNPDPKAPFFARPTIWYNSISLSADAAMSADPNSFSDQNGRIGPDIHGNRITNNTINGMFIRIRTNLGEPIDKLQVPARINDTDITYVLSENLLIEGHAGGPYMPNPNDATHAGWDARVAGSLVLDPGVILKMNGSRIEAQIGGTQLIAEGTDAHPVIFTSLKDDSYGAGGIFDTDNTDSKGLQEPTPAAGDYGGIFFNTRSSGSIDKARMTFAGGTTPIAGGFTQFNPITIQQASVRIANTLFQNNADGVTGSDQDPTNNRNGLLNAEAATIFVRGAQPVIVNNRFANNGGNVISINANSLNSDQVADWGRSTGANDPATPFAFTQFVNNQGPLVRLNRYQNNGTNGMNVRHETIMTETVWDDTDIVHVVRGEIHDDLNLHTYDGIRLQSSLEESLVVKLLGPNAGFTANGRPLDIDDRIGGTLQVIGTPGHPVILTSLRDDTVGAGFKLNGDPLLETIVDAAAPAPGDWRSLKLDQYSNDRNVAVVIEGEQIANQLNTNGTPATAEFMGSLAAQVASDNANNAKGGNDDQPLGFEVHGFLNKPSDSDVYSFNANGGTEVWFDISRTSQSLNTIIELIDANGIVLAGSDDSQFSNSLISNSVTARDIVKDPLLGGDFYTINPRDAGFRAILPGQTGVAGTYFIRVRSKDALTQGEYNLQVRLQQVYEHPGSTIRYADVRYATNGIEIHGLPSHSPLSGDSTSAGGNNSFATAQPLGNLNASDRNTISVSGALASAATTEWYKFNLNYDLIQSIAGHNGADKTWATIFDIDFADGLARPDLTLSIYDDTGKLILVSRDSNVNDDQPGALQGTGLTDASRGSAGKNDPFIGSVQMPIGPPSSVSSPEDPGAPPLPGGQQGTQKTYYVAISSNVVLPSALDATFVGAATNALIRMEPVSSVRRIVEDHIGFTGYRSGDPQVGTSSVQPTTGALLPIATAQQLSLSVRPFTLSDVVAYINTGDSHLRTIDAFNGGTATDIAQMTDNLGQYPVTNIQMRNDGTLWAVEADFTGGTNRAGRFVRIDPATGAQTIIGLDNVPDYNPTTNPPDPFQLNSTSIDSFVWIQNAVGNYDLYYAVHDGGFSNPFYNSGFGASRLYHADPNTGAVYLPTNPLASVGEVTTSVADSTIGYTTGMVSLNGLVYGVSSGGKFYTINIPNGRATVIKDFAPQGLSFTGLTLGPQNVQGGLPGQIPQNGYFADKLFATTSSGRIFCLDTSGNLLAVFDGGATSAAFAQGTSGFTFSPLDFNLWHPTFQRHADAGHGINASFDNTRRNPTDFRNVINGRDSTEGEGGASFYFGLESWVDDPKPNNYFTYGPNAQYGVLTTGFQQNLTSNASAAIGNNYNLPGGAYGSLVTGSFDLTGYTSTQKPALYFDYFLDTQNANSNTIMRDSARVFISSDGGNTWEMLATNNSIRSTPADDAELPQYLTASRGENVNADNQQVQELFDNTGVWRQARVDLGAYAGLNNLQLRFDFSTAGTIIKDNAAQGLPGDDRGVGVTDARRGQDNNHVGWYIDDLMVGFAGRGEMVTGSVAGQTNVFQPNPGINNDPNVPKQSLTGAYQLEIRRGTEYARTATGSSPAVIVTQQFDISDRLATGWSMNAAPGASIVDGQTFTITDGVQTVTFEYSTDGTVGAGNTIVPFTQSSPSYTVAASIRDAINGAAQAGKFKVTATLGDDTVSGGGSTNSRVDLYLATNVSTSGAVGAVTASLVNNPSVSMSESGGSTTVRITRTGSTSQPLTVSLAAIDPSTGGAANYVNFAQNPVTIPAGQSFVDVVLNSVNDSIFTGNRTVVINPTAVGFTGVATRLDVLDDEQAALTINFVAGSTVAEGGTIFATVTRNTPATSNLTVTLASLNPTEVSVPVTVTILAGQTTSSQFAISGLQDGTNELSATTPATIVAYANGFTNGQAVVNVQDSDVQAPIAAPGANINITKTVGNQSNGSIAIDTTTSGASQRLFMVSNLDTLTVADPALFVGGLFTSYSTNGGATWTNKVIADGTDPTIPVAGGWAVTASDGFGNLFVAYLNKVVDGNNVGTYPNQIVVLKSSDFGQTFTVHQTINALFPSLGLGAPGIAAATFSGGSSLWISYYDNALGKLIAMGAPVTGLGNVGAFGASQQIGGSDSAGQQVPSNAPIPNLAPEVAIGPTGAVMVAWQTGSGQGFSQIRLSVDPDGLGNNAFPVNATTVTSTNVGQRDQLPGQAGSGHGVSASISLAWDRTGGAHDGRVYMVYTSESVDEQNDTNILMRFSDNNGASWSAPTQVNNDVTLNSQFLPRAAIDQTTGNVAIVWYDARNDEAQGSANTDGIVNNQVQLWGAIAGYPVGLGGNTLAVGPNVQISGGTSKSSLANNVYMPRIPAGAGGANIDFGDRIGIVFNQGRFFPLWADNSTGLAGNPSANQLEMVTAAVLDTLTPNPTSPATIRVTINLASVTEGSSRTGTVTLLDFQGNPVNVTSSLVVRLTSNDPALATFPATVTILPGTSSRTFNIQSTNNSIAQGTRTLIVTPAVAGLNATSAALSILDDETAQLSLSATSTVGTEGTTIQGTVTRNGDTTAPLTVFLTSIDGSELSVPISVTIPANQPSATFVISLLEDFTADGTQLAGIIASAPGFRSAQQNINVQSSARQTLQIVDRLGDRNLPRQQGVINITSNSISHSLQTGILVSSPARDGVDGANLPHPGSVVNTPVINNSRQVPGPQISNNVIYDFGNSGIRFAGDPNAAGQARASIPFGRIHSNTIYGSASPTGTGIQVANNAAPTLLNNIVSNTATGISVDSSSAAGTVVGTTVFKGNSNNGVTGTNPIILGTLDPLFVSTTNGKFYLAPQSQAIDSSLNTLQDRPALVAVKAPLDIPQSAINAPLLDRYGQLRVDDPSFPNASGLGQNIFKDRGAVERADFVGPRAQIVVPLDNQAGTDADPTVDTVVMTQLTPLTEIDLALTDSGIGVDPTTVVNPNDPTYFPFTLVQDPGTPQEKTLVNGVDYTFTYNPNTQRVAFLSVSVFPIASNYRVTVAANSIKDFAGNVLQGNQLNGSSIFNIIGNAPPTLSKIDPLPGGIEDTALDIPFSQIVSASDLNDVNGSSGLALQIVSLPAGATLQISHNGNPFVAVVPGVTQVVDGDILRWKPAANANNEVNGNTPVTAFTVRATDGAGFSDPAIAVKVNVAAVPDAPILTTLDTFGPAGLDQQFRITYGDLLANGDEANVDGHPVQYRIESITLGSTLQIRHNGVLSAASVGTIVDVGDALFWTPPAGQSGNGLTAFTLVAYDGVNAANFPANVPQVITSTPAVAAKVNVLQVKAPTMTSIATLTRLRFVQAQVTFAELQAASNVSVPQGANLAFKVDSVLPNNGSLFIIKSGTNNQIPLVAGMLIESGDRVLWNEPAGATGLIAPFSVLAIDKNSSLTSLDAVQVQINLVNAAPTLSTVNVLPGAVQQTDFPISYQMLLSASNAQDGNGDAISFRITSIDVGDLVIIKAGTNNPVGVQAGQTLVSVGDVLIFKPGNNIGNSLAAFKVAAFDGSLASAPAVPVTIQVIPFGSSFSLTGPWVVNGTLARINQNGASLTINDQNGNGSSGNYTGFNTITGRNGRTGKIDTTTADNGRILWDDGVVWLRLAIGGQYYNPSNNRLTSIAQNGVQLTFTNADGGSTTGTFLSATQVSLPGWGQTATWVDGVLTQSGGSKWVKLDLLPNYTTSNGGKPVSVRQDGSTNLVFVNAAGQTSNGRWVSPTSVVATDWNSLGTVINGQILWNGGAAVQGGTTWSVNQLVVGQSSGQGQISIFKTATQIVLTNKAGGTSTAKITGPNTIVQVDWGGVVGTRSGGKINWSNGTVWDNFDYNALDAIFSDIKNYSFPS